MCTIIPVLLRSTNLSCDNVIDVEGGLFFFIEEKKYALYTAGAVSADRRVKYMYKCKREGKDSAERRWAPGDALLSPTG